MKEYQQFGFETITHRVDFCVVGGGLAGLCAAIAAARRGSRVALMHERPMLGGNASSEIRMWVCGAAGEDNRAGGIIEEIELENYYRNPDKIYALWDTVLYEKAEKEKNLTLLLNCSCCAADCKDGRIEAVVGWQMTTQTWQRVEATYFADCSGDSALAALCGADFRIGRESADEFDEHVNVPQEDRQTMGMSCLIQYRKGTRPFSFKAPDWVTKMTPEMIALRTPRPQSPYENFWYLELGGDRDSIKDTEELRHELLALALGMWDYIKNSGNIPDADLLELTFLGFLPGKRESRRLLGPVLVTQGDILSGGRFEDNVAFGGWTLDDHHPGGFYHKGVPNTTDKTPSPYGIPYRALYSRNIKNLFFAGRNISMTHAAMSSARVMATCAVLGEAVGVAADIAREFSLTPHEVYEKKIRLLQNRLMEGGAFIPHLRRDLSDLTRAAVLESEGEGAENLRNGADRNNTTYGEADQGALLPLGKPVTYRFKQPVTVKTMRLAFDSDLARATLPGGKCEREHSMRAWFDEKESPTMCVPKTLVRSLRVTATLKGGKEIAVASIEDNRLPVLLLPLEKEVESVSFIPVSTWGSGADCAHVFSFDIE